MDETNLKLLRALEENARASLVELGKKVGLSAAAVSDRMRKLEEEGVIAGYRTAVNPMKLGFATRAFLRISTDRVAMTQAIALARATPEIKELHQTDGGRRFIARIVAQNQGDLERIAAAFADFGTVEVDEIVATPVEKYTT